MLERSHAQAFRPYRTLMLPARTKTYVGHRTDTHRWDAYQPRDGDIVVCTPPKCGTTWTQAICALLVFKRPDFEGQLSVISPWFDGTTVSLESCVETLKAQAHRRFIKTHSSLQAVPYHSQCTYLAVYRDPRDAYFSMRSHLANMKHAKPIPQTSIDPNIGFKAWLEAPFEPGVGDQRSLEFFIDHFRSYRDFAALPNLHFFHYADLKADLAAQMRGIATALGISVTDEELGELAEAARFENMKRRPATFAPAFGKGVWKDDTAFFRKGENAQWRGVIDQELLDAYEHRMAGLVSADEKHWLEAGGPVPAS